MFKKFLLIWLPSILGIFLLTAFLPGHKPSLGWYNDVMIYSEGNGDVFNCNPPPGEDYWTVTTEVIQGYEVTVWECGETGASTLITDFYFPVSLDIVEILYGEKFMTYCPLEQILVRYPRSYLGTEIPIFQYVCTDDPDFYGFDYWQAE